MYYTTYMGTINRLRTYYLFAKPSFIEGMSRVLDIGGTMEAYNEHDTEAEADRAAIRNDWLAVGDDIRSAMKQYEWKSVKESTPA